MVIMQTKRLIVAFAFEWSNEMPATAASARLPFRPLFIEWHLLTINTVPVELPVSAVAFFVPQVE